MRIAILGSAPSSSRLAPFADPSWTIWGCSPGFASTNPPRVDAFFELHRWGQDWLTREYREFLAKQKLVYMFDDAPDIPGRVELDWRNLVTKYGDYFFTSSVAWMLAHALEQPEVKEIGFWGIDMAADGEFDFQKPGCLHFIELARARGIKVVTPGESDLLRAPGLYGLNELSPRMAKLNVRLTELVRRRTALEEQITGLSKESLFLAGVIDDMRYHMRTWGE